MSSNLIICLFIIGYAYSAYSAQFQTKPYQHPDYPGQCYDKDLKKAVPVGESINSSEACKWQQCQPDFKFIVTTCAPVGHPDGCTVTEPDFTKPYPKCCPQLVCN